MVKLNLLPEKIRAAEKLKLVVLGGSAFYILLVGLLAWRMTVASAGLAAVNADIAAVETELKPLQSIADEVKKLSAEKTEQDSKKARLDALSQRQAYLVRALDLVPDFMQAGSAWLVALDQREEKDKRLIMLDGRAVSAEAWADFFTNLEAQGSVEDLKVEEAISVKEKGRELMKFRVAFALKEAP
jgi:Tfp pilus assembly protein PilN